MSPNVDYVCFTDDPNVTAAPWHMRSFDETFDDPARTAKKPKILAHRYFAEYDTSVWIDGNQTAIGDLADLAERHLAGSVLAMFGHPDGRTCIYDEAESCMRLEKDDPSIIRQQVDRYRGAGYPAQNGMPACMVLIRRHNEPALVGAMEDWWREITMGSRRDQLSFSYVAWKHSLEYARVEGDVRDNPFLVWRPHETSAMAKEYGQQFFAARDQARMAASVVVPLVMDLVAPRSVIDVGCGDGVWLDAFRARGLDVLGLDGEWASEHLKIPPEHFRAVDLAARFQMERNFDLAVSLEVAEHLPPETSEDFVASLVALAPTVLFSAAIPDQKGTHHVNLHWPGYWAGLFARHDFVPVDCIRHRVWRDERVSAPYSQNAMFFVQREHLERLPNLAREAETTPRHPPSLVHPEVFAAALRAVERREQRARDDLRETAARAHKLEKTVEELQATGTQQRRELRGDLHKRSGREEKLKKRVKRLERRLAQMEGSRWWQLGQRVEGMRKRAGRLRRLRT